jgi:hypothetical protein
MTDGIQSLERRVHGIDPYTNKVYIINCADEVRETLGFC